METPAWDTWPRMALLRGEHRRAFKSYFGSPEHDEYGTIKIEDPVVNFST